MKVGTGTDMPPLGGAGGSKPASSSRSSAPAASSGPARAPEGVPVSVSSLARALDGAMGADPDVNLEHVAAVKDAIAKGTYVVNAHAIADRLLETAVDDVTAQNGQSRPR